MADFCKYCGSALKGEEGCTCDKYVASTKAVDDIIAQAAQPDAPDSPVVTEATEQVAPVQAAEPAPVNQTVSEPAPVSAAAPIHSQSAPAAAAPQTSKFAEMSKQQFNTSKKMFLDFIKDPIGMIASVATNADKTSPLIFGGIHVLVLFLSLWIGLEPSKHTFKLGLIFAVIDIITTVAISGAVFFLAKKYTPETIFMNTLCAFCIATIPSTLMIIASLLVGIVFEKLALLLMVMSFISWLVIAFTSTIELVKTNRNTVFWFFLGILSIIIVVDWSIASDGVQKVFSDMLFSSFRF